MRQISASFRQSVENRHQEDADLIFITLSHPQLTEPIRVVSDTVDYTYDGASWTGFPFDIQLLTDDDSAPRAALEIQNVDQKIGPTIMKLRKPMRLKMELLLSSDFDLTVRPRVPIGTPSVEYVASHLYLVNVKIDTFTITGEIVGWDFAQRTWPGVRANEHLLPGLFR